MWRSLFLALAITLCVLGLECLVVKRATLTVTAPPEATTAMYDYSFLDPTLTSSTARPKRVIEPPDWAPFGLLSSGIVLLLYTKSLASG
jgi:hypothetical protein